jgi:hypothetical protein
MSRFIGGVPPAGYTGSGPVKPPGPRGPIKPKPGTKAPPVRGSQPGKPAHSTGGRDPYHPASWHTWQTNLVNQHLRPNRLQHLTKESTPTSCARRREH